jgi:uncharacterized damage-inducible protein DinB
VQAKVLMELVRGKGAHADAIACVTGVPLEVAGRRVLDFPHTVFGLVWHMAYWMEYELARIRGEAPAYPEHAEGSWPKTLEPRDDSEWTKTVDAFHRGLEALEALAELPPAEADRKVPMTHGASNQGDNVKDIVGQTIVHNSYHLGQVVVLRQALSAWPPPSGLDTW